MLAPRLSGTTEHPQQKCEYLRITTPLPVATIIHPPMTSLSGASAPSSVSRELYPSKGVPP